MARRPALPAKASSIRPATLESAEMMPRHLGPETPADRLDRAIAHVYEAGERLTPDRGGTVGTEDFATAVIDALA